ncbi:MAG: 3-deoxy-manno-octulosonate-8-phosphatase KdsC [Nitrospirae bacterium]|nr:3-deoxy-manno-octulosonate-8-phosphatase KdsC [Nitrospirota bacterium]
MKKTKKQIETLAKKIKLLILDVDGVLTDGSIILDNEGNELKSFHVRDGHGIKMLINAGIHVAIITGRHSKVVERRAQELGITEVFQKCHDKRDAYKQLVEKFSLSDSEIAYIGDDIVDISLLKRSGFSVAVADADDEVKADAMMITRNRGGRGAVREVCDFLLKAKGLWQEIIDEYSKT